MLRIKRRTPSEQAHVLALRFQSADKRDQAMNALRRLQRDSRTRDEPQGAGIPGGGQGVQAGEDSLRPIEFQTEAELINDPNRVEMVINGRGYPPRDVGVVMLTSRALCFQQYPGVSSGICGSDRAAEQDRW